MTATTVILRSVAASALMAFGARGVGAQGAPPRPAPTVAPPAAPLVAPPAAPSPPPPAPTVIVPASSLPPSDSAVALCKNGTWIYEPGAATDCAQRGGLVVAMPARAVPPAVMAVAARAAITAPARIAAAPPAGSTMQCKDGTFLFGAPTADRCAGNGGVAAIFTRPTPAPPPSPLPTVAPPAGPAPPRPALPLP